MTTTRWTALALAAALAAGCGAAGSSAPPPAPPAVAADAGALTSDVERVLADIRAADAGELAVSEEDGRFLRVLVGATGARQVLEIGGASGYSAIWLGLGLRQTGGRLVTIEYDADRARALAANIERAGLSDVVRVVHGNAFEEIPKVEGAFDLVFLDAWKPDYVKFFEQVFPRVRPGGVFVAHNVINKRDEMADFLAAIDAHPGAFTTIVAPGREGMSLTYKKRTANHE